MFLLKKISSLSAPLGRFQLVLLFYFYCILINLIIRTVLTINAFSSLDTPMVDIVKIFFIGIYNDSLFFSYFLILPVFFLAAIPNAVFNHSLYKKFTLLLCFLTLIFFTFIAHSEWFFWEEFTNRFNFIAVDYLIYTQEVVGNIQESYPMHWVYTSVLTCSIILFYSTRKWIVQIAQSSCTMAFKKRMIVASGFALLPIITFFTFGAMDRTISHNRITDQLARNGLYEAFSAFRKNVLEYKLFYPTLPESEVVANMKKQLATPNSHFIPESGNRLYRQIENPGPEKKYNVVLIAVESLSASFMATFGNTYNLTPNLDELVNRSLFFPQLYATGKRTVRGLEALMLSLPPTAGYSVVKRPENENLFNLGTPFKNRGYDLKFIYGGFGYFDNMNYFFEHNGFAPIDRSSFKEEEITFSNIWGVSDENLFDKVLSESDASHQAQKPFFNFVLTTSNHRPYTYPEGRIDIPSKTGRDGAVKYTDFAIAQFLKQAESHPWFDNTIFIIVADHCASGSGKTNIPVQDYHIPLWFYAPKLIPAQKVDTLTSQIDIGPTLLGLLNFSYPTKFLGQDVLKLNPEKGQAFLGTYQNLGLYRNGVLLTLSPKQQSDFVRYDRKTHQAVDIEPDPKLLNDGIAYYQFSSFLLRQHYLGKDF